MIKKNQKKSKKSLSQKTKKQFPLLPKLIGLVQLPPMVGAPGAPQTYSPSQVLQQAGAWAVDEVQTFARHGVEAVLLENFGDTPYYRGSVPPETIASLSILAAAMREAVSIPIGISVLQNDARAALAVASVAGCNFIRIKFLTDGFSPDLAFLIRERDRLRSKVLIFVEIELSHVLSSFFGLEASVEEIAEKALADAIIFNSTFGSSTKDGGVSPLTVQLEAASQSARSLGIPLYMGTGMDLSNFKPLRAMVDGVILGQSVRQAGLGATPLDPKRVLEFVRGFYEKGDTSQKKQAKQKSHQKKSKQKGSKQKKSKRSKK